MFPAMPEDHLQVLVSAKAVICHKERILLARNSRFEWDLPGGKLHSGESLESALRRELMEELNVKLVSSELLSASIHHFYPTILVLVYGCRIGNLENMAISSEHSEIKFFELDNLPVAEIPSPYIKPIELWCKNVQT
jgi:8-oxo-dGTP pyrophosphatase MutT (NUDIX family)